MLPDLGAMYRASRLRITDLMSEQLSQASVSATPLWTGHDVIAHLAGITQDVATGNMTGVTTDPWTAAQVARGRQRSLPELLAMWEHHAPMIEDFLSSPDGASVYEAVLDIHTHEADLLTAASRPVDLPRPFLMWIQPILEKNFTQDVVRAGLPTVQVQASDLQWFRGRLGRRTEAEACSYGWSQDPRPYLDTWFIFGRAQASLRETSTTDKP